MPVAAGNECAPARLVARSVFVVQESHGSRRTERRSGDARLRVQQPRHAKADLGEHAAAVEALQQALAVFSELGMTGEGLRARCVLGRVLLAQAEYERAREMLLEARAGFRELGMTEECGLAGIELTDALIGLGQHVRARMVIEDVITDFRQAKLSERALTAVAYLREMIDTPQSRDATRHVREYLKRLHEEPQQVFLPLPPH